MKKLFTLLLMGCAISSAHAQYQLPNSDFEGEWVKNKITSKAGKVTHSEDTPEAWHSFYHADGNYKNLALGLMANQAGTVEKTTGYDGTGFSATIISRKNSFGSISNGNLTTGIVHMGSTTADDPANYNYSKTDDANGHCKFAGYPDSVKIWTKFVPAGAQTDQASMNIILHTDAGYKDPSGIMGDEAEKASRTAKAYLPINASADWTAQTLAFDYNGDLYSTYKGQKYLLVSFSTNVKPGSGAAGDALSVDHISLVYNSELASLTFNGNDIFKAGEAAYDLSDTKYDTDKLAYTANGKGATIETSYNEASALLTLTVKGNDWSVTNLNQHVYTIQFAKEVVETQQYSNTLLVNAFGTPAEPTQNTINLIRYKDGSYSFELKQFAFGGMLMGDIVINNLDVLTENDITTYSKANEMVYIEGLGTEVPVNLKAIASKGNMTATINIPLAEGMEVNVSFAPCLIIDNTQDVTVETDGLYNITFNRLFPAGWSSICLPYATTTENLGAVQVQAFTGCDQNTLTFQKVGNGELAAHTPYLIYFENATTKSDTPWFCIDGISATVPTSVTHGNVTFVGNYEAGKNMEGLYGVAEKAGEQYIMRGGKGSTLGSTGAYFTVSGSEVNTLRIRLEGTGTGISDVEAGKGGQTFDVYSLNGIKVRSQATTTDDLPKGIYLINGKKHIVK